MSPENVFTICVDCRSHAAVPDGNRCRDCLAAYLRESRPAVLREPRWRTWTREHGNAKDLTGAAA